MAYCTTLLWERLRVAQQARCAHFVQKLERPLLVFRTGFTFFGAFLTEDSIIYDILYFWNLFSMKKFKAAFMIEIHTYFEKKVYIPIER